LKPLRGDLRSLALNVRPEALPGVRSDYYAIFFTNPDGIRLEVTNFRQERVRGTMIGRILIGRVYAENPKIDRGRGAGALPQLVDLLQEPIPDVACRPLRLTAARRRLLRYWQVVFRKSNDLSEKEMKLDGPVQKYLTQFRQIAGISGKEITLLHLATHTSGLAARRGRTVVCFFCPLHAARGSGTRRSIPDLGTGLLGHVIALKADKDTNARR